MKNHTIIAAIWGLLSLMLSVFGVQSSAFTANSTSNPHFQADPNYKLCSQHAPKCALDPATWPNANSDWQYTGKRWHKISTTQDKIQVQWEWSRPYQGQNSLYQGAREDYYTDFSSNPNGFPTNENAAASAYEFEIWKPIDGDYRWMKYAGENEDKARAIGNKDCTSGVNYPVITQHETIFTTALSVYINNKCISNGYVIGFLDEDWGEANSTLRINKCDDPETGVLASESVPGNMVCKTSPHVGKVYQGYAWAQRPDNANLPVLGCEAVIYVWGWPYPSQPQNGQDYQAWFRNGELRFSLWIGIWDQPTIPDINDHAWWVNRCSKAWSSTGNYVYSGRFSIGNTQYTDNIGVKGFLPLLSK